MKSICVCVCVGDREDSGISLIIHLFRNLVGLERTFTLLSCDHQPVWWKENCERAGGGCGGWWLGGALNISWVVGVERKEWPERLVQLICRTRAEKHAGEQMPTHTYTRSATHAGWTVIPLNVRDNSNSSSSVCSDYLSFVSPIPAPTENAIGR